MSSNGEPKILLDCDVVIHFLKGGKILELPAIFPGRFIMLDKVHQELMKRNSNALKHLSVKSSVKAAGYRK
jgi:hypothetical protein